MRVFVFVFFGWIQSANAVSFMPVAGYSLSHGVIDPSSDFSVGAHSVTLSYGFLTQFKMFRTVFLETGFIFSQRGFKQVYSDSVTEVSFTTGQIPLVLRFGLLPALSLGLGVYFSHGFGGYSSTNSTGTLQNSYNFSTYGADDYGGLVSLALEFPLVFSGTVVLDVRSLLGMQNVSHFSGVSTTLRDEQLLAGIKWAI